MRGEEAVEGEGEDGGKEGGKRGFVGLTGKGRASLRDEGHYGGPRAGPRLTVQQCRAAVKKEAYEHRWRKDPAHRQTAPRAKGTSTQ